MRWGRWLRGWRPEWSSQIAPLSQNTHGRSQANLVGMFCDKLFAPAIKAANNTRNSVLLHLSEEKSRTSTGHSRSKQPSLAYLSNQPVSPQDHTNP
jgi:hypothetical protein